VLPPVAVELYNSEVEWSYVTVTMHQTGFISHHPCYRHSRHQHPPAATSLHHTKGDAPTPPLPPRLLDTLDQLHDLYFVVVTHTNKSTSTQTRH
jgi:hypothetical protein